ncbi:unnamed protein product, partial [Fusarium fujikuroi]
SVGDDAKFDFITKELGFDAGFNYKKESPKDALPRLAPNGIDIYFENVGGDHLKAALNNINVGGRIPVCGLISEYNTPADQRQGVKGLLNLIAKQVKMEGFLVANPAFGPAYYKEQENLQKWLADGSVKAKLYVTEGIDNAAEGFIGYAYHSLAIDPSEDVSEVREKYRPFILDDKSYSRLLAFEAARTLHRLGCDVRVYNPAGLSQKDDVQHDHPKVQELRELSKWSDGHVWISPE